MDNTIASALSSDKYLKIVICETCLARVTGLSLAIKDSKMKNKFCIGCKKPCKSFVTCHETSILYKKIFANVEDQPLEEDLRRKGI